VPVRPLEVVCPTLTLVLGQPPGSQLALEVVAKALMALAAMEQGASVDQQGKALVQVWPGQSLLALTAEALLGQPPDWQLVLEEVAKVRMAFVAS